MQFYHNTQSRITHWWRMHEYRFVYLLSSLCFSQNTHILSEQTNNDNNNIKTELPPHNPLPHNAYKMVHMPKTQQQSGKNRGKSTHIENRIFTQTYYERITDRTITSKPKQPNVNFVKVCLPYTSSTLNRKLMCLNCKLIRC